MSTSRIRCPALRPDPDQRHRLEDILAGLRARLAEAREEGWGGEVAGLDVSVAAAGQKPQAMDQLAARHQVTHLGVPDFRPAVGRSSGARGRDMNPLLITSLVLAGLVAGWGQRAVIFRCSVPAGEPHVRRFLGPRRCAPSPHDLLVVRRTADNGQVGASLAASEPCRTTSSATCAFRRIALLAMTDEFA